MKDINKLSNLPTKESMTSRHKDGSWYSKFMSRGGVYRKINDYFPWVHVERTLKKYLGKNVDKAFSEYCDIVDKCQQYMFWDELNDYNRYGWRHSGNFSYWFIDDNKRIQKFNSKRKKGRYAISSHDIRYAYVNIHTGKEVDDRYWFRNCDHHEYRIVEGELFVFDKKGDAYNRCYAEQLSKRKKDKRKFKAESLKKQYSFLTKEEVEQIKAKEEDKIKLESHGFDEVSFTNKDGRLNN